MAEAIISRRGYGTEGRPKPTVLQTRFIVQNESFEIPNAINNTFSVRIFGGGGGGGCINNYTYYYYKTEWGGGGGGGWMNNGEFDLTGYGNIPVTIGVGGQAAPNQTLNVANSGGTTSFGTLLSANGGEGANRADYAYGANGGSGGGGTGRGQIGMGYIRNGGDGYQFGGGAPSGNGGIWGGGAGGYILYASSNSGESYRSVWNGGTGGIHGGNGGLININWTNNNTFIELTIGNRKILEAENGTNTVGDVNVPNEVQGNGTRSNYKFLSNNICCGGAGGGYGGCGGLSGNSCTYIVNASSWPPDQWYRTTVQCICPGAGGGYGGNGGNSSYWAGGGGGGYIGKGGDGIYNGGHVYAGGGGGYGNGGQYGQVPGYGGGGATTQNGGSGICIIQYYTNE